MVVAFVCLMYFWWVGCFEHRLVGCGLRLVCSMGGLGCKAVLGAYVVSCFVLVMIVSVCFSVQSGLFNVWLL